MAKLIQIIGCDNPDRTGDVIFVHGLGGDGLTTWHADPENDPEIAKYKNQENFDAKKIDFWPKWLGEDRKDLGIWSLGYELEPSDWKGQTMSLLERGNNVLERFVNKRIGQKPIIFITHSMGGLLVKQLLRNAQTFGTERHKKVLDNTEGIVFLATPHSGSQWSNWVQFMNSMLFDVLKLTESMEELEWGNSPLQELNYTYRGDKVLSQIPVKAYYETVGLKFGFKHFKRDFGVVVDKISADMGKSEPPIAVGKDHITICKVSQRDKENGVVYDSVSLFLEDCLPPQ